MLVNDADFSKERIGARGNTFLIKHEGRVWAVTGMPWIEIDSVDKPTIPYRLLTTAFKSWRVYPRVTIDAAKDTFALTLDSTQAMRDDADILLLKPPGDRAGLAELTPQFELPAKDDTLYLIGCPRTEPECSQKAYRLVFQRSEAKGALLTFFLEDDVNLDGFGGAPILTKEGRVVGLLIGGGSFLKLNLIQATHIAVIKQILR